ncbi:MAG: SRPBCC family protein [Deltaproteobacteria bacterium]|nr:SRPBCC family protein [Deltaproteobacteria bacterium]
MEHFSKTSLIAAPAQLVFGWHEAPEVFEKLTPPWEHVRIIERSAEGIKPGTQLTLEMRLGPLRRRWIAVHTAYEPGRMFRDEQLSGPFKIWVHTHSVTPKDRNSCELTDDIQYQLPFGWIGRLVGGWLIRRKLNRLFDYRHRVTKQACEHQVDFPITKNRSGNLHLLEARRRIGN